MSDPLGDQYRLGYGDGFGQAVVAVLEFLDGLPDARDERIAAHLVEVRELVRDTFTRTGFGNFPVCDRHHEKLWPGRTPTRVVPAEDAPERRCCFCNQPTNGIGVRLDRRAVSYPETEL